MLLDLNSLSLEEKVGQLFFIGITGPEIDEDTHELLETVAPGGVCLFARNIREARQTRSLLDGLRNSLAHSPLLSVDQEGGLVDRLRRITTRMPAANKLKSIEDAGQLGELIAGTLRTLGFNMDFAPVVDVINDERAKNSNGLYSRQFGASATEVATLTSEFLRSLQDGGITGCLKHFPGLGASTVDSHEELPEVVISSSEFESVDLLPYRELLKTSDVRAIMVAHAAFPLLGLQEADKNGKLLPSSLSRNMVTGLLREELAFDGVVITDDLEMGAIARSYGIGPACSKALHAGVDMLAICADPASIMEGFRAVLRDVRGGHVSEGRINDSLRRIGHLKSNISETNSFDTDHLSVLARQTQALNERLG